MNVSSDFLPDKPLELSLWLGNASTVANANLAAMGLVTVDVTNLNTAKTNLDTANVNVESTKEAYRAAVVARNVATRTAVATARAFSKKVQGYAPCPANLKMQAGLNVRKTPEKQTPPNDPNKLVATGFDNGTTLLTWLTDSNKRGTVYQIEAQSPGETDFKIIAVTSKSRYELTGQTPGEMVTFRVCAIRSDMMSGYSNTAVVYYTPNPNPLILSKAA
jgi:hypothetical protein